MGIKQKFSLIFVAMIIVIGGVTFWLLERSNSTLINLEANRIANIVTTQIVSDRAVYTKGLVGKLKQDGVGAARDSHQRSGYIMLPAQFVRAVSKNVDAASGGLYQYSLVSEWNLNDEQGLQDDFDRWAWSQLKTQDDAFAGQAGKDFQWQPVSRIEEHDGQRVLKYMRADPASAAACVSCHNAYENREEVIQYRNEQGVDPGKQWQLNQLMGAIKVTIPISNVEALASESRTNLLLSIGGLFVVGFVALIFMLFKNVIQPIEHSVNEVARFKDIVDDVISKNSAILDGSDKEMDLLEKEDVGLDELRQTSMENASNAQLSAAACGGLEKGFTELNEKMQKMLGKKV